MEKTDNEFTNYLSSILKTFDLEPDNDMLIEIMLTGKKVCYKLYN